MKIRNGFVSNSSSASFVIALSRISNYQKEQLLKYPKNRDCHEYWNIVEDEKADVIRAYTPMDNGDIQEYMDELGIDRNIVVWSS